MKRLLMATAGLALAGAGALATLPANAFWGLWGGGPWYGGPWWGGYPGYGWGYPGYGWGYPGYGWGYPGYGLGYPYGYTYPYATVPAAPTKSESAK